MESKEDFDIRTEVAKAYEKALERSQERSAKCCATSKVASHPCCAGATTVDTSCEKDTCTLERRAGYNEAETAKYGEASASSFACGNPLAFAGVRPGQVVLDLGAGAGLDLLLAAEKVGPEGKVIGVDLADKMIDAAKRNAERAGYASIIEVRKGHIEELPVDDQSVDWIISNCVINLSPNKAAVFREIARVLKPGGRFSVSDIVAEDLPDWLRGDIASFSSCVAGAIPEKEYVSGLEDAGLVDVEITERYVYSEGQIGVMVANDPEAFGMDNKALKRLPEVADKLASVKVTGRRPE